MSNERTVSEILDIEVDELDPEMIGATYRELETARRRLRWLKRFWTASACLGHQGVCRLRREIAAAIKREEPGARVSEGSLERLDQRFQSDGIRGLLSISGRRRRGCSRGFIRVGDVTARVFDSELRSIKRAGLAYSKGEAWYVWAPLAKRIDGDTDPDILRGLAAWALLVLGPTVLGEAEDLLRQTFERGSDQASSSRRAAESL